MNTREHTLATQRALLTSHQRIAERKAPKVVMKRTARDTRHAYIAYMQISLYETTANISRYAERTTRERAQGNYSDITQGLKDLINCSPYHATESPSFDVTQWDDEGI